MSGVYFNYSGYAGSFGISGNPGISYPYSQAFTDDRPDYEKIYDIYVKNKEKEEPENMKENKLDLRSPEYKKLFIDAAKIAWGMSKMSQN